MNTYLALYTRGGEVEVKADTTYAASQLAVAHFQKQHPRRKVKGGDVSVHLVALNDEPYVHVAVN